MGGTYMKFKVLIATIIAVLAFSSMSVMAANSPSGSGLNNVKVNGQSVGKKGSSTIKVNGGSITVSGGAIKVGKKLTITANPNNGNTFTKWVITGDYTIVSGDLNSAELVIIPKSDVSISAVFTDPNGNELTGPVNSGKETKPVKNGDSSSKSPKTGVATGFIFLALLASAGIAFTTRKSFVK